MDKQSFNNDLFQGTKGRVMLELSKTFKGDSRFKLDNRFKDDIDVDKLPQKFKQIADKDIIQKVQKKKKIKKNKPLIIQRFQPGTAQAQSIVKKAQGIKKYEEGLRRHQQKIKKKSAIQKGIDKSKKAQMILNKVNQNIVQKDKKQPKFEIKIHGNRKQAFQQKQFKLFG